MSHATIYKHAIEDYSILYTIINLKYNYSDQWFSFESC